MSMLLYFKDWISRYRWKPSHDAVYAHTNTFSYENSVQSFSIERCAIQLGLPHSLGGKPPHGPAAIVCDVARDTLVTNHLVGKTSDTLLILTYTSFV